MLAATAYSFWACVAQSAVGDSCANATDVEAQTSARLAANKPSGVLIIGSSVKRQEVYSIKTLSRHHRLATLRGVPLAEMPLCNCPHPGNIRR